MKKKIVLLIAGIAILSGGQSFAAAFALNANGATTMGTADAGAGSLAEDATTIWYNPAGLTRLCGMQVVAGGDMILPVSNFDDEGSLALGLNSSPPPALTLVPINGNDGGGNIGQYAIAGLSYFSCRIDDCWAVGLGITSPFGLVTDYSNGWKGRYQAVRSTVLTININPTIAYKINDCWSVGAGFDVMYLHAKLSNKIDFGLLGILAFQDPIFGLPQANDAFVHLKGNGWGYGGNVGVLFEPWCGTRFGISYRSEVKQDVRGKERFDDLPANLDDFPPLAEQFQDTRFKSKVTLPQSVILSAYHELNDCFAVVTDAVWTNWDVFKNLRIKYNNTAQAETVLPLKWNSTWKIAVGGIYTWDCNWKFRVGFAYEQGASPNKRLRSPRVPDNDTYWAAFGVGYNWNDCLHFDIAYEHIFLPKAKIDQLSDFEDAIADQNVTRILNGALKGKYNTYLDFITAQIVYSF